MDMRFSLRFNNDLPIGQYTTLAQAAERAGFDQFWVVMICSCAADR